MRKRRRFTPEFKAKVVLEVLAGTQSPAEACRKHALSPESAGPLEVHRSWSEPTRCSSPTSSAMRTRPGSPSWSNCSAGPRVRSRFLKKLRRCWMRPRPETGDDRDPQG